MAADCRNVQDYQKGDLGRDDAAMETELEGFVPESGAPSLRMISLDQEVPQVELAIGQIRATCTGYRAGKLSAETADDLLGSYEQTIADFEMTLAREARMQAASGNLDDLGNMRAIITRLGVILKRTDSIQENELADAARKAMFAIVETFDDAFSTACYQQSFEPEVALAFERQRELIGLPTDVSPCANRPVEARWKSGTDEILWKHCGIIMGDWKVTMTGLMRGSGKGFMQSDLTGDYRVDYSGIGKNRANIKETGSMRLRCFPEGTCDCQLKPGLKKCKGGGPPPGRFIFTVVGNNPTGEIFFPPPVGPQAAEDLGSVLTQDYPVTFKKLDKPCKPESD
jgi:hypothetical protein